MRQYQFVQIAADVIELRIVPGAGFGDEARRALHTALWPVLPGVTVRLEILSAIPPEPSGKYRIVQSLLGRDGMVPQGPRLSRRSPQPGSPTARAYRLGGAAGHAG